MLDQFTNPYSFHRGVGADVRRKMLRRNMSRTGLHWNLTGVHMKWNDLTQNWAANYAALQTEFPNLEPCAMPFLKADQDRFESYLAATHDMSLKEAQDALDAYLSRRVNEMESA